jgi:hypothetical protein
MLGQNSDNQQQQTSIGNNKSNQLFNENNTKETPFTQGGKSS